MKAGRSPELALLLMVCVTAISPEKEKQISQFLSQHQLNWDRFYTLANRHRIVPFLYRALQDIPSVSPQFLAILRQECRLLATDNLLKLQEYHQITKLFSDHNIEHVAFKGLYLAENSYPDSSLRGIGDFDILVAENNIFKVILLLESNHYQLGRKYRHYLQYSEYILLDDLHEVSLIKPFFNKSYFDIDLHWEIECFTKYYASLYLHDINYPSEFFRENQLILLIVHHGVINIWQHLVYVNDLYFSINDKDINWTWLLKKLRQYGLETVFLVGIYWCRQIWHLTLPPSVEKLITTEQLRTVADAYEKNWEAEKSVLTINPGLQQIRFFTNSQTQFTKKLKIYSAYINSFVFRSSLIRIGKYRFYIPRQLGFLSMFFRIIKGIYKSLLF